MFTRELESLRSLQLILTAVPKMKDSFTYTVKWQHLGNNAITQAEDTVTANHEYGLLNHFWWPWATFRVIHLVHCAIHFKSDFSCGCAAVNRIQST